MQEVEILLVEDSPEDAELTVSSLKKHHITNKVLVVEDGEEALDFLFARGKFSERVGIEQPKVVLLDLKLPKVSGMEVLQVMKSEPALRDIPVVILTSSQESPDLKKAYRLGVNSYVVKPVDFESFASAVSSLGMYWLLLNKAPPEAISASSSRL